MKLYFVRHTAVDVPQNTCYGYTNVKLAKSFPDEAAKVLDQIKEIAFDAVFMSPSLRCVELTYHCGFQSAIVDQRLKEMNFGDWEMQHWDEIKDANLQVWHGDPVNIAATNGESFRDLYARFSAFIEQLPPLAQNVAVFTHSGIINCARVYAGEVTLENMLENTPHYGSITELEIYPGYDQSNKE